MKYLGKTSQDPFVYKGSGKRWVNHIKKHGYDVTTEVLGIFSNLEEFKKVSILLSEQLNIVKDDSWANLKIEEGDGGDTSNFIDYTKKKSTRGKTYEEIHGEEKAKQLKKLRGDTTRQARKGKTWDDIFGKEKAEFMRAETSKRTTERNLQRVYNKSTGEKISKANFGRKHRKTLCEVCHRQIAINNLSSHQKTHQPQ